MNFDCEINQSARDCLDLLDRYAPEEAFGSKQSSKSDGGVLASVGLTVERVRKLFGTVPMRRDKPRRDKQVKDTARKYLPLVRYKVQRGGDWSHMDLQDMAERFGLSRTGAVTFFNSRFSTVNPSVQQCVAFINEVRKWNREAGK